MTVRELSLTSPGLFHSPHPVLHTLREIDPVHWSEEFSSWLLLRYDDVADALRSEALSPTGMTRRIEHLSPSAQRSLEELRRSVEQWMGLPRIEDHKRYAKLLRPRFSPREIGRLEPYIRESADSLLLDIARRGGGDVVTEFAYPYSASVIAHTIGLPPEDRSMLIDWSQAISEVFHVSDFPALQDAQRAVEETAEYLHRVIEARRREPRDDLVSLFLEGMRTGLILDEDEIVANLIMMVAVGFETTSNVIATGTFLLLESAGQWCRLLNDRSLVPRAVEEVVRYDGPVFITTRVAKAEMVLGSKHVKAGDTVLIAVAAANRDPSVFADPDEFVIDRADNRHLGFGTGPYSCLGAQLARLEVRIAFEQMLSRMPDISLARSPEWQEFRPLARWLSHLWVEC
ncbi:cytochrome P450 [Streptomyces sp. SKN60]|uniref:cytochrome P450 n=1 Tax=Streptomyces sp. SKN60 TaxID=2855506 RepID=UPI0022484513|nr:cytochrome P450 [Streptomyces sp. SKN60]MCX2185028.1 cytochrome P450 [Streptomyces sp. SKN60]